MARALVTIPQSSKDAPHVFGLFDDFLWERDELWTDTADAGGSDTIVADGVGGELLLKCDGDDNDEVYRNSKESFLIAADKPIVATIRLKHTEANTDDANVIFGLGDAAGANALVDNGGGVYAATSFYGFYKIDGETRWRVRTDDNATVTDTETDVTAGGGTYQTLRIEINPKSSTESEVIFSIDDAGGNNFEQCREQGANPRTPNIKKTVNYSATTGMAVFFGIKSGGANEEDLFVDYVEVLQAR